jgi:hypothetical protein
MVVTTKNTVFWDGTPCSMVAFFRRFRRTLVNVYRITRRHIPGDAVLFNANYAM